MDEVRVLLTQFVVGEITVDQFLEKLSPILVRLRDEMFEAFDSQPELKEAEKAVYKDYQASLIGKDELHERLVAIGQQVKGCEIIPYSLEEKVLSQLFGHVNVYEEDASLREIYQIGEDELKKLSENALKELQAL